MALVLHAKDVHLSDNFFKSRNRFKITLDTTETHALTYIGKEISPETWELLSALKAARAQHPLSKIKTHDKDWVHQFEINWFYAYSARQKGLIDPFLHRIFEESMASAFAFDATPPSTPLLTVKEMQKFWDIYGYPALSRKLSHKWRQNDPQLAQFILSVFHHHPWWNGYVWDFIVRQAGPLVNAVVVSMRLWQSKVYVRREDNKITVELNRDDSPFVCAYSHGKYTFRQNFSHKRHVTYCAFDKQQTVRINKKVRVVYDLKTHVISIVPRFSANLNLATDGVTLGAVNGLAVRLPLVWRSIVLETGMNRFKFLLKGKRWQVILKSPQNALPVMFNDLEITKTGPDNRYRFYHPRTQRYANIHTLRFYNSRGQTTAHARTNNTVGAMAALDKDGLLVARARIRCKTRQKSRMLDMTQPFTLSAAEITQCDVVIPKSKAISLAYTHEDTDVDIAERLMMQPAAVLETELLLTGPVNLSDLFWETFHIRPLWIEEVQALRLRNQYRFILYVHEEAKGKLKEKTYGILYVRESEIKTRLKNPALKREIKK